jgi:tRNA(fMet)-specific endonuclease VapC
VIYLLDTNICIALLKGSDQALVERIRAMDPGDLALSSTVKAELLFGARKGSKVEQNLALLESFFSQFESLSFDDLAAEHYGQLRAVLEKKGTMIGANDLLIASVALTHGLILLTRNRKEFSRVPGLRWEEW